MGRVKKQQEAEERPTKWAGGRVRYDREGRATYEIRKLVRGVSYFLTLSSKDEEGARLEYTRFMDDRDGYVARYKARESERPIQASVQIGETAQVGPALVLDAAMIQRFQAFLRKNSIRKKGAGCSDVYVADAERYLTQWMAWLNGADLRDVNPMNALAWAGEIGGKERTAKEKRIKFMKALGTWLQKYELRWRLKENWTLELPSEQSGTRKEQGAEAYRMEDIEELYRRLDDQRYRDVLRLLAGYGVHYSELTRSGSRRAKIEDLPDATPIAGVIRVWHKNKKWHPILVDAPSLAAAKRLLDTPMDTKAVLRKFQRACGWMISQKNKVTGKNPNVDRALPIVTVALFRHTFVSTAKRCTKVPFKGHTGMTMDDMVVVTGHSLSTARKHYDLNRMPPHMVVMPLKLRHPEDPRPPTSSASEARPVGRTSTKRP